MGVRRQAVFSPAGLHGSVHFSRHFRRCGGKARMLSGQFRRGVDRHRTSRGAGNSGGIERVLRTRVKKHIPLGANVSARATKLPPARARSPPHRRLPSSSPSSRARNPTRALATRRAWCGYAFRMATNKNRCGPPSSKSAKSTNSGTTARTSDENMRRCRLNRCGIACRLARNHARQNRVGPLRERRHLHRGRRDAWGIIAARQSDRPSLDSFRGRIEISFDDKIGIGRHADIVRPALHQIDGLPAQQRAQRQRIEQRGKCRPGHDSIGRIAPQHNRSRQAFEAAFHFGELLAGETARREQHGQPRFVNQLHVAALDVPPAGFRVDREDQPSVQQASRLRAASFAASAVSSDRRRKPSGQPVGKLRFSPSGARADRPTRRPPSTGRTKCPPRRTPAIGRLARPFRQAIPRSRPGKFVLRSPIN